MPQFIGRHTIFPGFGRSPGETPPGVQAFTWWGSDRFRLAPVEGSNRNWMNVWGCATV